MTRKSRPDLLVIVGPTASGKTALAHALALREGGEVVSADAFAVYRGLDVGTAKPSAEQRAEVRYHMIDVAGPAEAYSAGRFAAEARPVIEDIARRGRLPVVCGGSGFYVAALLGGLPPEPERDARLRPALADWARLRGPEAAHRFLSLNDPASAERIPVGNLKYILRALEILLSSGAPASARTVPADRWSDRFRVLRLGVRPTRAQLHARIEDRVRRMLDSGWDEEVRRLLGGGLSQDSNSFQAIGYREVAEWVLGRLSRREVQDQIVTATRSLAKRQMTWFSRERGVRWVSPEEGLAAASARLSEATDEETR